MVAISSYQLFRRIRCLTALFIMGLVISGLTAIPLAAEVAALVKWTDAQPGGVVADWLLRVQQVLHEVDSKHPFLAYGTDWLAFGHFIIALVFVGAWRDPVRNKWLFDFGLWVCVLVIPWALVFGAIRGIPLWWRWIDCSFGVLGFIPMWLCRRYVKELKNRREY